jgi:hypothetical protein
MRAVGVRGYYKIFKTKLRAVLSHWRVQRRLDEVQNTSRCIKVKDIEFDILLLKFSRRSHRCFCERLRLNYELAAPLAGGGGGLHPLTQTVFRSTGRGSDSQNRGWSLHKTLCLRGRLRPPPADTATVWGCCSPEALGERDWGTTHSTVPLKPC